MTFPSKCEVRVISGGCSNGKMPACTLHAVWLRQPVGGQGPALTGRLHPVRSFVHVALLEEAFGFSQKTHNEGKEGGIKEVSTGLHFLDTVSENRFVQ